jgi:putative glutamine amidotransferase
VGDVVSSPPLIGVSTSEVRRPEDHGLVPQGEPRRSELALGERYLDAVRSAGGLPVILAPVAVSAVDPLLERLDAVCLSGGPDLHPSAYGAEPHPELGPTEPELDLFELALARRAVRRGLPVLGVCRGTQVLNVALGGTLHQHLPDLGKEVQHRQTEEARRTTHEVELVASSRVAKLIGRTRVEVNSFHHQAPAITAPGLRVVGRAADGTVEAVEASAPSFVFGVQWHAECLVERPEHFALFEGLVKAGAEHAATGLRAA